MSCLAPYSLMQSTPRLSEGPGVLSLPLPRLHVKRRRTSSGGQGLIAASFPHFLTEFVWGPPGGQLSVTHLSTFSFSFLFTLPQGPGNWGEVGPWILRRCPCQEVGRL